MSDDILDVLAAAIATGKPDLKLSEAQVKALGSHFEMLQLKEASWKALIAKAGAKGVKLVRVPDEEFDKIPDHIPRPRGPADFFTATFSERNLLHYIVVCDGEPYLHITPATPTPSQAPSTPSPAPAPVVPPKVEASASSAAPATPVKGDVRDLSEKLENLTLAPSSLSLEGIAQLVKTEKFKNIICLVGAGVSVAAGIPDFRTPGTGLYSNLAKFNLPYPEAVFEINFFKNNPKPFCLLAKELYPGNFAPTDAHLFIRLLHERNVLLRCYTQNIDTLERVAGIPPEKLVEAHGSFGDATCTTCQLSHTQEYVKTRIFADNIPKCRNELCDGVVKPNIVFFGESLPKRFWELKVKDFAQCDLLIVMGTSLKVQPFASLIYHVSESCPRLLINREIVGTDSEKGFRFDATNKRDAKWLGDVQEGARLFVAKCGWSAELSKLQQLFPKPSPPPSTPASPAAAAVAKSDSAASPAKSDAAQQAPPTPSAAEEKKPATTPSSSSSSADASKPAEEKKPAAPSSSAVAEASSKPAEEKKPAADEVAKPSAPASSAEATKPAEEKKPEVTSSSSSSSSSSASSSAVVSEPKRG